VSTTMKSFEMTTARTTWAALVVLAAMATACGDDESQGSGGAGGGSTTTTSGSTSTTTGSVASSTSGTGGDDGAGGADGPGAGEECDPVAQDCADPEAPKCRLDLTDPLYITALCAEELGDLGLGEPCSRPTETQGVDDCAAGLYCSPIGEPLGDPQSRRCRTQCDAHDQCGDGYCTLFNSAADGVFPPDVRAVGVCFEECDPLDPEACVEGAHCGTSFAIDFTLAISCQPGDGDGEEGASCTRDTDCAPTLGCFGGACRPWCDLEDDGCAEGSVCAEVVDAGGQPAIFHGETYGACIPAQP
jgi:hypothetical protein